ncbi:MAG: DUF2330 domain-containing protein [Polyangiaceae bacterium]
MATRGRSSVALAAVIGLLAGAATWVARPTEEAAACGGFFAMRESEKRKPSLSYEQVLIVYDEKTSTEHFIRQVTFKEGATTFGFVVPTPSRPEVAKVATPPFASLRRQFPFASYGSGLGHGAGSGTGQGFGSGAGSVTVLETVKVGSFTAFILAADDNKALAKWLDDNGLKSTAETDAWLAHYVQLKFYYVAMRYDPPEQTEKKDAIKQDNAVKAETIDISFKTPAPYYPYLEPKHPTNLPVGPRLLELWFVSQSAMSPISLLEQDGKRSWVRPLQPGLTHEHARDAIVKALGADLAKLLPAGELTLGTFQDQKFSRVGFGDILFAPKEKRTLDEAQRSALTPLLGILDPMLLPPKGQETK